MPHYQYRCARGHEFEQWVSIHDDSMSTPCDCGGTAIKVMVPPQISPKATPNRSPGAEPARGNNSWEKGIATDKRGMPILEPDGAEIPIKKYGEERHRIEAARHRLANDPNVLRPERGEN